VCIGDNHGTVLEYKVISMYTHSLISTHAVLKACHSE